MDTSHDRVVLTAEEHPILAVLDDASGHTSRRFRVLMVITARTAGLRSQRLRDTGAVLLLLGGATLGRHVHPMAAGRGRRGGYAGGRPVVGAHPRRPRRERPDLSQENTGQLSHRTESTPVTTLLAPRVERNGIDIADEHPDRRGTRDDCRTFTVTAVSSGQRCVTVALHGQLEAGPAQMLFGQLVLFCVGDPWLMVADMSDVTFIDADGVTTLVDARHELRLRSCDLTLKAPSATVRRNLELADVSHLVER